MGEFRGLVWKQRVVAIPSLTDAEWVELTTRLTHYAACKLARLRWRGLKLGAGGTVPGGVESGDLAADAIVALIEGKRTWNQQAYPTLLGFLQAAVDSMVSNLVRLLENRVSRRPTEEGDAVWDVQERYPDPGAICAAREEWERYRDLLLKEITGDKLVEGIFQCLEAEVTKRADMAVLLGVDVKEIDSAQKRLRRKIEAVVKKFRPR